MSFLSRQHDCRYHKRQTGYICVVQETKEPSDGKASECYCVQHRVEERKRRANTFMERNESREHDGESEKHKERCEPKQWQCAFEDEDALEDKSEYVAVHGREGACVRFLRARVFPRRQICRHV